MRYILPVIILLFSFISACSKDKRSNRAGNKMQEFIIDISEYAKSKRSDFAIIPQNGAELLFWNLDDQDKLDDRFIKAIDGVGIEELFYNGEFAPDNYRLMMLLQAKERIPVFVADYLNADTDYNQAVTYNTDAGFVAFPRLSTNYDYIQIPDSIHHENALNVTTTAAAQNYLYLISTGGFTDKSAYLTAIQQTNFDLVIIDAFYGDEILTSAEVNSLKTKANGAQRMVIAYMSVGSAEKYRYYWKEDWKLHKPKWLAKEYDGYSDEIWVKFWKKDWESIIYGNENSYTKRIIDAGFDGAYLDNVEAFYFLYFDD